MDLHMKGRGVRITDQIRETAAHKLAKVERFRPRATRMDVELIQESPRIDGGHRAEISVRAGKKLFRAVGSGRDVDAAIEEARKKLESQMATYRGKLRNRPARRTDRLTSDGTSAEGVISSD